jgi:hypothetical protein
MECWCGLVVFGQKGIAGLRGEGSGIIPDEPDPDSTTIVFSSAEFCHFFHKCSKKPGLS